MSSPLYDSLKKYVEKQYSSFHTPGHKGEGGLDFAYDITEISGFESLYSGEGVLRETEKMLTGLFGEETILSAGGSTLGLQAMIAMATQSGDTVIASRGMHQSAVNAFALMGITPIWIFQRVDGNSLLPQPVTPAEIEAALKKNPHAKGVYVTSPDYYGQNVDVRGISTVCKSHGKTLMIDSAHGAHYPFFRPTAYPVSLGADICCASLHKTLPVMTGGAVLSFNENFSRAQAKKAMSLFGSTSPSYTVMASADLLGQRSREEYIEAHRELAYTAEAIKEKAEQKGFLVPKGNVDPIRIALGFFPLGYEKEKFLRRLWDYKIQPEYIDDRYCVLIPTVNNNAQDFERLTAFIEETEKSVGKTVHAEEYPQPTVAMSLGKAVFAPWETVETSMAIGRVASNMIAPCPPGMPEVMPGELIDETMAARLKKDGVFTVNVIQCDHLR